MSPQIPSEGYYLQFPSFLRFSHLKHVLTTREYPFNFFEGSDQKKFLEYFGMPDSRLVIPRQIHGSDIAVIDDSFSDESHETLTADAVLSLKKGIWIGILVADCAPLLYYDPVQPIVAVVHVGWRGLIQDIHLKVLSFLTQRFSSCTNDIWVGIGPAVGPCCFQVKEEVARQFQNRRAASLYLIQKNHYQYTIDLRGFIFSELIELGILSEHIDLIPYCTSCRTDLFYSYRREGKSTGRILLAAALK